MKFIITEDQKKIINNFFKTINEQVIKPNTKSDITKFQNWVINTKKDSTILGRYGADGDWGPKTQNAWGKYGNEYLKSFRSKDNTKPKQSNEFPYNILNTNPTSKVIANIIKQSYGGPLGNDKEAWAEAAFNKIGNKEKYNNVSKLLGQDVFKYISSFMDTNQVYHKGPSIQDRYSKIFKVVKGGKKPQTRDEILKFQNWVINTKGDKVILGKYGADGDWGPASERAWVKYGSSYDTSKVKVEEKWTGGYVIPFAFPEYQPSCDGKSTWDQLVCGTIRTVTSPFSGKEGTYGKLGHAGVATVTNSGGVQMFEFGRYGTKKNVGLVKSKNLGNIAKIVGGEISNLNSVIDKIHRNTQGQGPSERIEYAVLKAPNIEAGITHAKSITKKDYSAFDFSLSNDASNCATYALEVVKASGINLPDITGPTPVGMISRMKDIQLSQENKWAYYLKQAAASATPLSPEKYITNLFM